jgi:uncharacterized membrane protein YdjX (TVP38/TMEM64 family)
MRPRLVLLFVGVAAVAWLSYRYDLGSHLDLEGMRALVEANAPYGPLVFMGACVAGIFLHLPELVLIAIGGMLFDAPQAIAYGWTASMVGATATFLIVRYLARESFQRTLERRFARLRALDQRLEQHGFRTVLILRLVLCLAPPLNWALGATSVRLPHYVAGTALGVVPGITTAVLFAESIVGGEGGAGRFAVLLLVVAALLVVTGVLGRRLLARLTDVPARRVSP